jgi:UTP--glucose-1-phosphate uridylyltransferase
MPAITKAVILAAGLGTRMLPATKAIPKEMLTIVDKPLIQYAVEEAVAAGVTDIVMVIAEGKEAIRDHFGTSTRADVHARESGDAELLARVSGPAQLARFHYTMQDAPRGIAHAVATAREFVEGEPFALLFPDDLILGGRSCVAQLADAYAATGGTVLAVQRVAPAEIPQYGIVDPAGEGNPTRLRGVVEKPPVEKAPSNLGIVGRYILSETIFRHIDTIEPGVKGELQITDAIASQIAAGERVSGYQYEGRRYDTGRPLGYLVANLAAGLDRPDLAEGLRERALGMLEDTRRP